MVPRDEPCPKRGVGLTHSTAHGSWVCVHCDVVTFDRDDPIAKLRAQYVNGETYEVPPTSISADFKALSAEQWHRAVLVRSRVESGRLTDWPNAVPLTDEEKRVLGEMGDIISRLRRVK